MLTANVKACHACREQYTAVSILQCSSKVFAKLRAIRQALEGLKTRACACKLESGNKYIVLLLKLPCSSPAADDISAGIMQISNLR